MPRDYEILAPTAEGYEQIVIAIADDLLDDAIQHRILTDADSRAPDDWGNPRKVFDRTHQQFASVLDTVCYLTAKDPTFRQRIVRHYSPNYYGEAQSTETD